MRPGLNEIHDHLTATQPGFLFRGERIPLINPQRGIFKPQQMRLAELFACPIGQRTIRLEIDWLCASSDSNRLREDKLP